MLPPSGIFTPASLDADFLLFSGGSGVTPIISIAKSALLKGTGRVVVFYANRDEQSVIFASRWAELAREYPDRLLVVHWLETVQGLPSQEQLKAFAAQYETYDAFVCGPAPFMAIATGALKELRFPRERRHQEKFISLGGNPFGDDEASVAEAEAELADADADPDSAASVAFGDGPIGSGEAPDASNPPPPPLEPQLVRRAQPVALEVELDGENYAFDDWDAGTRLLDFLESKGIKAPYSCREGECSACAFRLLEGDVEMAHNDVLDKDDLADGIRLGCQSTPTTEKLRITYS